MNSTVETELTFIDLVKVALSNWKLLLLTTLVGSFGGLVLSRWIQPVYEVDALVQIQTEETGMPSFSSGELEDMFTAVSKSETESEILGSRMVLLPVVDTLHLEFDAFPASKLNRILGKQGRIDLRLLDLPSLQKQRKPWLLVGRNDSTLTLVSPRGDSLGQVPVGQEVHFPFGSDTAKVFVDAARAKPGEVFQLSISDPTDVASMLYGSLKIQERGKKTGILELTFKHRHPDMASKILNEVTRSYMRQNIDAKSAEASKTLVFLKQQLPFVKSRLDSADSALNAYRLSRGTVDLTAEAKLALDRQVELGQQMLELQQKKQELSRLYEEGHPQVAAINSQIARIKGALGSSSGKVRSLPKTQQEVLKLTRDVTVATQFYEAMRDKIQQLEVVRAGEVGTARIIDTAQAFGNQVAPKGRRIILLGLVGGLLIGYAAALTLKLVNQGAIDASVIERITQTSVFAQIPISSMESRFKKRNRTASILAQSHPDDLAIESLRGLRTALEFSLHGESGKILAISGLTPGVGKSFVSVNLASLFASTGKRVLLIDGDLRKGRLHGYFANSRTPGLSEVLSGKLCWNDAIHPPTSSGVSFLATGTLPPNPSEMLGSDQLSKLLSELKTSYDLVIVDTSPVLLVTDPTLIFRHSDHTTLILEQGAHSNSEIQEAVRLAKTFQATKLSFVLNKCALEFSHYGKYGKYTRSPEA